jgi:ribokinase
MQAVRFVAIGELLVDVVATGSGHAASIAVGPGGSAFNAAVTAATLGAEAAVIGAVGNDSGGRMILGELAAHGVHAQVAVSHRPTGTFLLVGSEIRVDRAASRELVLPETIEADAVLVSGYLAPEAIAAALTQARAAWVGLDVARLDELPSGGNALIANEEAARRLTGETPEQAVRALAGRYRLACVTSGPQGAMAVLDGTLETAEAPHQIAANRPGAGDAFAAALFVSLARGADLAAALPEACRWGARAAAVSSRA